MGYNDFYEKKSCSSQRNNENNKNNRECDCESFFKNISRGEEVKVFFKGGGHVFAEFINVRGNVVILAKADCRRHEHDHDDCKCKKDKVRIITICCEDIVAVEV
jgi:hypothetical protein